MRTGSPGTASAESPLYLPPEWTPPSYSERDIALDLLRGLAMMILVVNHTALESPLRDATRAVLSAAEVLVMVSGVVVGMVFGRRWLLRGGAATTLMLLRRARKLYLASVVVVALVGLATLVPGLETRALTVSPRVVPPVDSYEYDGALRTVVAVVTLEAGPWQFNILGFFVAVLALAPVVLFALARGWWPLVVVASWTLYLLGRDWHGDVLPSQSERPFPLMVWQVLFVGGVVLGWHRDRVAEWVGPRRKAVVAAITSIALLAAAARLAGPSIFGSSAWAHFESLHLHKASLDPLRLLAMTSATAAIYAGFRRGGRSAQRAVGRLLLPLGRSSFYVFIMHVFICLALASVLAGGSAGPAGNVLVQLLGLGLLWVMVRRRFLFKWVPR